MLISTKGGDKGSTFLLYGARVRKDDLQVEAYGTVDELNSALGVVRASSQDGYVSEMLLDIQAHMLIIGSELATPQNKTAKKTSTKEMVDFLERKIDYLERAGSIKLDWATPGDNLTSAYLDLARSICRRAERRVVALFSRIEKGNDHTLIYLNRLSDLLWITARYQESVHK